MFTPPVDYWKPLFLFAKITRLEIKKINAHSMMEFPNSMLPTSCRMVATRTTKKKKDSSLSRELNFSTQLMNQVNTNPLRALRTVGWAFLGLFVVDVLLCFRILQLLHTPCTACCKSPLFLVSRVSPIQQNSMKNGYDENNDYGKER